LLQKERKSVTITIQFKLANKRVQEDVFKKTLLVLFFFHVGFSRREGCAIFLICVSFFLKKKIIFLFFPVFFEYFIKIEEREKRKKK
jgi:hypothetical protein